jgi:hypothetical protein
VGGQREEGGIGIQSIPLSLSLGCDCIHMQAWLNLNTSTLSKDDFSLVASAHRLHPHPILS